MICESLGVNYLEEAGRLRVPLLLGAAVPGVEHAEADLAVVVEVGVEAHRAVAGRLQVDERRRVGVVLREVDVELEAAVSVRRVRRASDQHLSRAQPHIR